MSALTDIDIDALTEIFNVGAGRAALSLSEIVGDEGERHLLLEGEPGPWGTSAIASNALLHEAALEVLGAGQA